MVCQIYSVQVESIIVADYGVVCSGRRYLTCRRTTFMTIPDQKFPFVGRVLELVEVKCNQVIEEEALNLPSKYVKSGAQDV